MNFGSFWIDSFLFALGNVSWTMFQLNFIDKKTTTNKQNPNKQTKKRKKERKYKGGKRLTYKLYEHISLWFKNTGKLINWAILISTCET